MDMPETVLWLIITNAHCPAGILKDAPARSRLTKGFFRRKPENIQGQDLRVDNQPVEVFLSLALAKQAEHVA